MRKRSDVEETIARKLSGSDVRTWATSFGDEWLLQVVSDRFSAPPTLDDQRRVSSLVSAEQRRALDGILLFRDWVDQLSRPCLLHTALAGRWPRRSVSDPLAHASALEVEALFRWADEVSSHEPLEMLVRIVPAVVLDASNFDPSQFKAISIGSGLEAVIGICKWAEDDKRILKLTLTSARRTEDEGSVMARSA